MTRAPLRAPALTALLAALCVSLPVTAGATTLIIQFTGLDLVYNGDEITASMDPLTTMTFGYDTDGDGVVNDPIGVLLTEIEADIDLALDDIPATGGAVTGGPLELDLFMTGSHHLELDIMTWEANYLPTSGGLFFFGAGAAQSIDSQDLPFDIADVALPVHFSFSAQIAPSTLVLSEDQESVIGFNASGTGEVTAVPEPGTAGLLGLGLLGLAAAGSPRQRRAAR